MEIKNGKISISLSSKQNKISTGKWPVLTMGRTGPTSSWSLKRQVYLRGIEKFPESKRKLLCSLAYINLFNVTNILIANSIVNI